MKKLTLLFFFSTLLFVNSAYAKKEVIYAISALNIGESQVIEAIENYADGNVYNVTVWETSVIQNEDLKKLNAADVVIMGRNLASMDVTEASDIWDSVTTPIICMNMWTLRGHRANWVSNEECGNFEANESHILKAEIMEINDPVFKWVSSTSMDWWKGDYALLGTNNPNPDTGNRILLAETSDKRPLFIRWKANVEFYPGANHTPLGERVFIGCGVNINEQNYFGFANDGEQVFFNELARLAIEEPFKIVGNKSQDAGLASLTSNVGTFDSPFNAQTTLYDLILPTGSTGVPEILATASDSLALIEIYAAENLNEATTIVVIAEDRTVSEIYTVTFSVRAEIAMNKAFNLEIYPNPASEFLNIHNIEKGTISIFNIHGKLLLIEVLDKELTILNVNHLKNGAYIIQIQSEKGMLKSSFIKH